MIYFKSTLIYFLLSLFAFSGCSSAQRLQTKSPIEYNNVYFQKWVAGVKEGGSGLNLFIPIHDEAPKNIQLDSVYFRGKSALLEKIEGEETLYVGRFKTKFNEKQEAIIKSGSDKSDDSHNSKPEEKSPFELKDSECVISYKEGNKINYFKIENVLEKQAQKYPSAPNRHE